MELVIRKFQLLESTLKEIQESSTDMIGDVVVALEIGFLDVNDGKKYIHSHTFCFHYCLDKYEGETNVSFMILDTNQQTGQYCFWEYGSEIYKKNIKSKKIQIENTKISIPKIEFEYNYQNKAFPEIIEIIKKDLIETHFLILKKFDSLNISYDSYMDVFTKELNEYIRYSYENIYQSDLSINIKEYEFELLDLKLHTNQNKNTKKIKI